MRNVLTPQSTKGLSATQRGAIKMLASGCTPRFTALVLKIKQSELRNWISRDEGFQTALDSETKGAQKIRSC